MPTLKQFKYLVLLNEERHFRKAAQRANVTQPTLSAQIKELEFRLKAPLLERGGSGVVFTPLGREIVGRAQRVLSDVQDIIDLAASSEHGFHGTVRLGVPPTLGPYLLPYLVPGLHSEYPQLKLYVREGKPADLQAELLSGSLDLVVSPLPISQGDLTIERLFREPLQVAVSPDHQLAKKDHIERSDLVGENVLAIEKGHHLHDQVSQLCSDFGANLLRDYEGTSLDTLRHMVGMGVGISFLPALYIRSEIGERGEVVILRHNISNMYRQIGLAWRHQSVHSELFGSFASMIRKTAGEQLAELEILA